MKKLFFNLLIFLLISLFAYPNNSNYNLYAFNLYKNLSLNHHSIGLSPYSVRMSLLQIMLGACGRTYQEFMALLYPQSLSKEFFYHSLSSINDRYNLTIANKLYVNKNEKLQDLFCHHSHVFFNSQVETIDFSNPLSSSQLINSWISQKTKHIQSEYIKQSDIDDSLKILALNIFHFKGSWQKPFDMRRTQNRKFYLKNSHVNLSFMVQDDLHYYFEDKAAQMVLLPIKREVNQSKMVFIIFLPKTYCENPLMSSYPYFTKIADNSFSPTYLHLEIPKFKQKGSINLNQPLKQMGLNQAFSSSADFSKINGKGHLFLSKILHQYSIELNEEGLSSSSISNTCMGFTIKLNPKKSVNFLANRPFSYAIVDLDNKTSLFMGQFFPHG